ncbi:uncharacterized protein J7T54_008526 [Emericellopsis cladophorae]|uniref:Zn(2)-C6 fungal-type domain-containing protein n=1 Tax=Emericellopsis cladophorae TaxID=2686198 RepID=A0A9P9XZU1_9HYPO|nr:uncharacterized protein J7T54_008526 [Emericellopsis cladophorae]KAI6780608.1 hypothetical protein J7T54_008526 [Emericellopsis cladophorae]
MPTSRSREICAGHHPSRRSRHGCRNCKLRKLKCDEGKPQCKKCCSFGVLCNFMPQHGDLQPVAASRKPTLVVQCKVQPQPPFSSLVWTSDESYSYLLSAKCQDFVTRYLGRSLITPDDPAMVQVNHRMLRLAFTNPFLMHASLAVAFAHDRYLLTSYHGTSPRNVQECYHWAQGTALLQERLKEPIQPQDKDAVWGTAAALAMLSFASSDVYTPQDSWPLRSSGRSDLDWLRMNEAKDSLWHIVNPLRRDSLFSVLSATYAQLHAPLPDKGADGIPPALAALCWLTGSSTVDTNPYLHATHAVAQILQLPDSEVTTGLAHPFMRSIRGPFKELLLARDAVALLLLYLWYRKASRTIWWIALRARVEAPAISSYLQLHHGGNAMLQAFLPGGAFADGV